MKSHLPVLTLFLIAGFLSGVHAQEYLMPADIYGQYCFIDTSGTKIIREKYDDATSFSEGLAAVQYTGKWGYIDKSGSWIINPGFTEAKPFSEGMACARTGSKWGFIDRTGHWVIEPAYFAVSSFSEGRAVVFTETGFQYIDKNGRNMLSKVFKLARPFSEGAAYVETDSEKGFIDIHGNWLFHTTYDMAYSYSEGLAMVMKNGRFGFINRRGILVVPMKYRDGTQFSEGLAGVKVNRKWGYIDRKGELVIPASFDYGGPFNYGFAVVKDENKYGLIDLSGTWILNADYRDLGDLSNPVSRREEVEQEVRENIRKWEMKGEFEKTPDYLDRVTAEKRNAEIRRETKIIINKLASGSVRLNAAELGFYNADAEMFNIDIPGALPTLIPVPISDAEWFRDHWDQVVLDSAAFSLNGEKFLVTNLIATVGSKRYAYNALTDGVPASDFEITSDLGEIVVSVPDLQNMMGNTPTVFKKPAVISDVDRNIPVNPFRQDKVFAVVIGNEDYTTYQVNGDGDVNVDFAGADARTFRDYLTKTLGVPDENITLLINATAGQINQSLARLSALAKAFHGDAKLIFYYAGHGLPDEQTREPYIIPVDVSSSDLTYAISLESVYNKLTENPSERVTVFLDACFSGGSRNQPLLAGRGIRIRPKSPFVRGNLVVFSATSNDETAYAYNEKGHGMFTYHLLKELQLSDGKVTYGSLAAYLSDEVSKKSLLVNNREQVPEVNVSPVLEDTWKNFSFLPEKEPN